MSKRSTPSSPSGSLSPKRQKTSGEFVAASSSSNMSKRSTPSSPSSEQPSKRRKMSGEFNNASPVAPAKDSLEIPTPGIISPSAELTAPTPAANDEHADAPEVIDGVITPAQPVAAAPVKTTKQPAVKLAFDAWKPDITHPAPNDFWGIKPVTGDPRPDPNQPSARDSNAATNPHLWEERGYRFKRGSRYVKYFGSIKPEGSDDGPDLDQEGLLVIKLIDMRPKSKHDQSPRRKPTSYFFEAGKPKDWNNMQAIKALNDRRGQAIDRVTVDAPWTRIEREYLAEVLEEHPDASIWELTERHNDRFMGKDFVHATGFAFVEFSEGRTVESVRHEYLTYKPAYDSGEAPKNVRWRKDKSVAGKNLDASKAIERAFGPSSKALEKEFDNATQGDEDDGSDNDAGDHGEKKAAKPTTRAIPKKATPAKEKKTSPKKATKATSNKVPTSFLSDSEDKLQKQAAAEMSKQPQLSPDAEELLALAGLDDPEEIRTSPPLSIPSSRPRAWSFSSGSSLSDVPSDLHSPGSSPFCRARSPTPMPAPASVQGSPAHASSPAVTAAVQPAPEVVIVQETVVQQTAIAEQPQVPTTPPRAYTPLKAARDIIIDDNYDDDDEKL